MPKERLLMVTRPKTYSEPVISSSSFWHSSAHLAAPSAALAHRIRGSLTLPGWCEVLIPLPEVMSLLRPGILVHLAVLIDERLVVVRFIVVIFAVDTFIAMVRRAPEQLAWLVAPAVTAEWGRLADFNPDFVGPWRMCGATLPILAEHRNRGWLC